MAKKSELLSIAKPILFNTYMVQAILDGRKTATRRVIKYPACGYFEYEPPRVKEPYKIGDILYVRETWNICNLDIEDNTITFVYKASEPENILSLSGITALFAYCVGMVLNTTVTF